MTSKLNYSGDCCLSGVLIAFSGLNLSLNERYRVAFENIDNIPANTNVMLNPTGYFLSSSDVSPVLSTFFVSRSSISDNSSLNTIKLSIYNSENVLVHTDYKTIVCQNLCGSGFPITPTPTRTPTQTPTPTPTPTPPIPPLNIRANFDRNIIKLSECSMLVRAKAYGDFNKTYSYSFGTDMTNVDLKISNPSGYITITDVPTYVYTNITLPDKNKKYYLEFGISDQSHTVQDSAIFSCDDSSYSTPSALSAQLPLFYDYSSISRTSTLPTTNGIYLRFMRVDDVDSDWHTIYVPDDNIIEVEAFGSIEDSLSGNNGFSFKTIDFDKVLPNGEYIIQYDLPENSDSISFAALNNGINVKTFRTIAQQVEIKQSRVHTVYNINISGGGTIPPAVFGDEYWRNTLIGLQVPVTPENITALRDAVEEGVSIQRGILNGALADGRFAVSSNHAGGAGQFLGSTVITDYPIIGSADGALIISRVDRTYSTSVTFNANNGKITSLSVSMRSPGVFGVAPGGTTTDTVLSLSMSLEPINALSIQGNGVGVGGFEAPLVAPYAGKMSFTSCVVSSKAFPITCPPPGGPRRCVNCDTPPRWETDDESWYGWDIWPSSRRTPTRENCSFVQDCGDRRELIYGTPARKAVYSVCQYDFTCFR